MPVSYVVTPITEGATLRGAVLVFLDITERNRAEAVLRQARDELEARVLERTRELAEANEVLQVEFAERKAAEDEVRRTEQRYRLLFEHAPVMYAVTRLVETPPLNSPVPYFGTGMSLADGPVDVWGQWPVHRASG